MLNTTQMIIVFVVIFLLMNYSCPRITKENFDADCYLKAFPDVQKAGVDALTHYNSNGKQEIESGKRNKPNCDLSLSTDKGYILPATDFNCQCYLDRYSDLGKAGIKTCDQALEHYNTYGKKEGRDAKCVKEKNQVKKKVKKKVKKEVKKEVKKQVKKPIKKQKYDPCTVGENQCADGLFCSTDNEDYIHKSNNNQCMEKEKEGEYCDPMFGQNNGNKGEKSCIDGTLCKKRGTNYKCTTVCEDDSNCNTGYYCNSKNKYCLKKVKTGYINCDHGSKTSCADKNAYCGWGYNFGAKKPACWLKNK